MKSFKFYFVLFLSVILGACGSKSDPGSRLTHKSGESSKLVVYIQPFGNVNLGYLTFVKNSLQNDFRV